MFTSFLAKSMRTLGPLNNLGLTKTLPSKWYLTGQCIKRMTTVVVDLLDVMLLVPPRT